MGATHFINSSETDPVPIVQELTGGGADVIFEVTGEVGSISQLYWALGIAGRHIQIGVHDPEEKVVTDFFRYPGSRIQTIGCNYGDMRVHSELPALADLVMDGKYDLSKLTSKVIRLEDVNEAAEATKKRQIVGRWVVSFE